MFISIVLLLLILICCCYLPAFLVFHDRSQRVSFTQSAMYLNVGMASLGVLGVCAKASGIDIRFSVLPGICMGVYALIRYNRRCLPKVATPRLEGHTVAAIALSALYFLHILIPGILMGRGPYPPVFFNIDITYYLGQIHALIRSASWPPPSLGSLGESAGYHYGSQILCALFSQLTGLTPHASAFLVYMPILSLGIICVIWLFVQRDKPEKHLLWIGVLLLLFIQAFYPIARIVGGLYQTLYNGNLLGIPQSFWKILLNPQIFSSYPMLSSQMGLFSAVTLVYCLQNILKPSHQRLAVFIVGILPAFKTSDFLPLGLGFGLWILYEIYRTHKVKLLLSPIAALVIGLGLSSLSKSTETVAMIFAPWQLVQDKYRFMDFIGSIVLYTLPVWIALKYYTSLAKEKLLIYWVFILPSLIIPNVFGMVNIRDQSFCNTNLFQITRFIPLFLGIFVFVLIHKNWAVFTRRIRSLIMTCILLVALLPVSHKMLHTAILLVAPEYGHEYVNNRSLGEALTHVPVENSILVTNDFRYPAENYGKGLRQLQFPALFGHQAYAIDFVYAYYRDSDKRFALQERFREVEWDQELERLAQQLGWTHLVIHRESPHSQEIPLPLIFENDLYQVYTFGSVSDYTAGAEE